MAGVLRGVTYFDEVIAFFKDNYDELAPAFVKAKNLPVQINNDSKKEILNMHDAFVGELKVAFSAALGKDRLYHKPCGFLNDQQIWMMGVQLNYLIDTCLRFSHADFMKALKLDLGPILGDLGLWSLKCLQDQAKENGENELKKKYAAAHEIVEKYLENGFDTLSNEKKYHMMNKFSPKKCPDQQIKRETIRHLYSWNHYAPIEWFNFQRRQEAEIKIIKEGKAQIGKLCSACQSPEGSTIKHKVCSACKTRFYCSTDCQRADWNNGHKAECKEIQKKQKK